MRRCLRPNFVAPTLSGHNVTVAVFRMAERATAKGERVAAATLDCIRATLQGGTARRASDGAVPTLQVAVERR